MEHSATMSLSHQKLADKADVACCLGSAHGPCSQCEVEAAFVGFTITDFGTESEHAKHLSQSPKITSLPDDHRCKKFPCPVCNPGRFQRGGLSSALPAVVTPQMLEVYAHGAVQQLLQNGRQQTGVISFGDGGHVCRRFPCPICGHGEGRSAALEVEVGC